MSDAPDTREITPLTVHQVRTWAAIEAVDNDLASAAFNRCADEIERLRGVVDRLVKGMTHPDRCPASYGPMHCCDCGVQKLIDSVMP